MTVNAAGKKKVKEQESFERLKNCRTVKGLFASDVHKKLLSPKWLADYCGERPDIILYSDDEVFGIEHCQVDELFKIKKRKAQSMVDIQRNNCENQVNKYMDKDLLDADIKSGAALEPVFGMVEERFALRNDFDYSVFIDNFRRVCKSHNDQCIAYRSRIEKEAPNKSITLACLVDIPYSKETTYLITDDNGTREQAIKGIPITKDMLSIIQHMSGFDLVIFCMYNLNQPKRKADIVCYFFRPLCVREDIIQQRIIPLHSFGMPRKAEVRFPINNYSVDDSGNVRFVAKVKMEN